MASENGVEEDEKLPAPEEDIEDGPFEIINLPRSQDKTYLEVAMKKLGELDLSRRPVYQQLGVGGVSGWCVGNVFKKVGKAAALAIGGGLIMLQLASQSGYITINWKKVNKDVGKVSKDVSKRFEELKSSPEQQSAIARYFNKGGEIVQKNIMVTSGFVGGFLLGLAT